MLLQFIFDDFLLTFLKSEYKMKYHYLDKRYGTKSRITCQIKKAVLKSKARFGGKRKQKAQLVVVGDWHTWHLMIGTHLLYFAFRAMCEIIMMILFCDSKNEMLVWQVLQ